jgi:hypothetical protein
MTRGSDDKLEFNLFPIEEDMQRRLSSSMKQTNITDFFFCDFSDVQNVSVHVHVQ